jgi:hypothetical protein
MLKVIRQEREEVISLDKVTKLYLTSSPKYAFGFVMTEHGKTIGRVYRYGSREDSRQKCIDQAQEIAQNQYPEWLNNQAEEV